jgi:thioredoxin reductase/bacterioferritin-associated ferredoxin
MRTTNLVIVGGGPAGLSAAVEAAKLGVSSIIIDENPQLGGQIFRQLPLTYRAIDAAKMGRYFRDGKKILADIAEVKDRVEVWTDSLVWGYFPGGQLAIMRHGEFELLKVDQIVIAVGAYDRPVPFPGWTLPGVMTAGCAQLIVKSQRVLPGNRFLLAGSGPLQLAVAYELIKAGANLVAVVEATSMRGLWRYGPRLLNQPQLMWDGMKYLTALKLHSVPLIQSHIVTKAIGHDEVEGAVIAAADKNWQPIPGTERTFEVDTICVGYGLIPNTDLTRQCGCSHEYVPTLGGWIPRKNENMETNVPGIFAAGDGGGINGVDVAVQQGRLAGIYATLNLKLVEKITADQLARPIRAKLKKLRSFQSAVGEIYAVRSGIYTLPDNDTIICRCEELTLQQIREAMHGTTTTLNDVKRQTRLGMGYCQGRMCFAATSGIVERELGLNPGSVGYGTARVPVKPIPIRLLLEPNT